MKIGFAGTPDFACPTFELLNKHHTISFVLTQPDRPRGRGQKVQPSPIKTLAQHADIPVYQPEKIHIDPWKKVISQHDIDVLVVVSYGLYIPQWLIDHPKYECLNIHPSKLPRWRGASPLHSALLNGDKETAVCIMRIVKEMDAGPVFKSQTVPITSNTNYQNLHDDLAVKGAQLMQDVIVMLPNKAPVDQAIDGITHAEKLTKQSHWYDPQWTAQQLHQHIQAFYPKPGVQTLADDTPLKIIWGVPSENPSTKAPGYVSVHKDYWSLATTTVDYHISHIQWTGKKVTHINQTQITKNSHLQIIRPQTP